MFDEKLDSALIKKHINKAATTLNMKLKKEEIESIFKSVKKQYDLYKSYKFEDLRNKLIIADADFETKFIHSHSGDITALVNISLIEDIQKRINMLEELIVKKNSIKEKQNSNKQPITSLNQQTKLNWNGPKGALYHIFYQLKTMNNNINEPLLNNTIEEIATFIEASFDGFEGKFSTIKGELSKMGDAHKQPKKGKIEISIKE